MYYGSSEIDWLKKIVDYFKDNVEINNQFIGWKGFTNFLESHTHHLKAYDIHTNRITSDVVHAKEVICDKLEYDKRLPADILSFPQTDDDKCKVLGKMLTIDLAFLPHHSKIISDVGHWLEIMFYRHNEEKRKEFCQYCLKFLNSYVERKTPDEYHYAIIECLSNSLDISLCTSLDEDDLSKWKKHKFSILEVIFKAITKNAKILHIAANQ